jgi:transcriptional regulator with XRE-family HTH domain
MSKTADRAERDGQSPRQLGRHLKHVRRKQGLSRAEVARSAGLTRRELAAYERGRVNVPESDLWCLAGSCGVDVGELLPARDPLVLSSDLSSLAVGDSIRHLRNGKDEPDGLLREYLSMISELRNLPPGSRVPLREPDLAALADALGGSPDAIEHRLMELIGAPHEEAARLRAIILPPLSLPSGLPPADPYSPPRDQYATPDPYATLNSSLDTNGVVDFFSAPRAEDPFSPPPPLAPLPDSAMPGPSDTDTPVAGPAATADPFAPHAPAPPLAGPVAADPQLEPPLIDPFDPLAAGGDRRVPDGLVVDRGAPELPMAPPDPFAPPADLALDPFARADAPAEPETDLGLPPDPFGFPTSNGHHDATSIVDHDVLDADAPEAPESFMSDPPMLDAPPPEPASGSETSDAPETPTPVDEVLEAPIDFTPPAERELDDVEPIAWIANDASNGSAPPLAAPQFEQVSANWRIGGISPATAMADDGALALRRADARWALGDLDAPGDFTIDAAFDFTAGAGFGVLFRAEVDGSERINGYSFDIDPVAGGGGFQLRQWEDNRPHWRALAEAPITDPSRLFGRHTVQVTMRGDHLNVVVDGDTVMTVAGLSHAAIALGRTPCRGGGVGVQASATTEVTVDSFRVAR